MVLLTILYIKKRANNWQHQISYQLDHPGSMISNQKWKIIKKDWANNFFLEESNIIHKNEVEEW
jgi:hypothetical protein